MAFSKEDKTINRNGRPKGTVNKSTEQIRNFYQSFLETNMEKMQQLFDEVAAENPSKAIELILKVSEFVIPKLKAVEVDVPQLEQNELIITIVDNNNTNT